MTKTWIPVQRRIRNLSYRPTLAPEHITSLGVRSVGHYYLPPGEHEDPQTKYFVQMFWSVRGTGFLAFTGNLHAIPAGTIAFYFPGDTHQIINPSSKGIWEYRFVTLDGDLVVPIIKGFHFVNQKVYQAGSAPTSLFRELKECLSDVTYSGEIRASNNAYQLLSTAAEMARPGANEIYSPTPEDEFGRIALQEIHVSGSKPYFGIEELAGKLGMHRSAVSRRFHAIFGLSPTEYLQRWRVKNALGLLRSSSLSIHEIAQVCGWSDPAYFSRSIRKATGVSPREFRRGSA